MNIARLLFACFLAAATPLAAASPSAAEDAAWETLALDVTDALAGFLAQDGSPTLQVRLTKASAAAFGAFTAKHVGETVEVLIEGAVVSSPAIREPIVGGALMITGGPKTDWKPVAARLRQGGKIIVRPAK